VLKSPGTGKEGGTSQEAYRKKEKELVPAAEAERASNSQGGAPEASNKGKDTKSIREDGPNTLPEKRQEVENAFRGKKENPVNGGVQKRIQKTF